jgi:hypothetical protein
MNRGDAFIDHFRIFGLPTRISVWRGVVERLDRIAWANPDSTVRRTRSRQQCPMAGKGKKEA